MIALFSQAILGWKLSTSLPADIVTDALQKALASGLVQVKAIFHSDRSCQYTAATTRALLARAGLRQSMSAAGYCYDHAFAESAFAPIKSEATDPSKPFDSHEEASTALLITWKPFRIANASIVPSVSRAHKLSSATTSKTSTVP